VRLSSAANLNNGNDPIVIDIEQLTPEQLKAIKERGVESVEISEEANENGEYDIVLHLGGTEPARPARRRPLHGADTLGQFYQVQAQQDNIDGLLSDAELNAIYEAQFQGAVTGAMFLLPVDEATVGVYIVSKAATGLVRLGSSAARLARRGSTARGGSAGAMRRLEFQASPKHGTSARNTSKGVASRGPTDGQHALDNSVRVKSTSPRRVGVDRENGEIVVFDQTSEGIFHGHVRSFKDLTSQQKNALRNAGLVDKKGKF
jgi:hypothetical protein